MSGSKDESENATVHRAAANDIDFSKPRGPRLRVQRFVIRDVLWCRENMPTTAPT